MPLVKKTFFYMFLAPLFLVVIASTQAAAGWLSPPKRVLYYKTPQSEFSSGETSLDILKKNQISSAQFVSEKEDSFYQYGEQNISKFLITPTFASSLNRNHTKDPYQDLGYFLVLSGTEIKSSPSLSAHKVSQIPAHTKIIPIEFRNGFVKIKYQNKIGFIDITNTLSKFDYARAVYITHPKTKITNWFLVKNRIFDQIELIDGTVIPLGLVTGLYTKDDLGIITDKNPTLPIWSKVTIKKNIEKNWKKSFLSGHGVVYWVAPSNTDDLAANTQAQSIDDLLKKEIYSISFSPNNPKKAVVSSEDGVLITKDGENWSKISILNQYKGPVLYYNDLLIYAGTYRSTDGGKSFEKYINISSLTATITDSLGFKPSSVLIKKMSPDAKLKMNIEVDTGTKTLKLQSSVFGQKWTVIK